MYHQNSTWLRSDCIFICEALKTNTFSSLKFSYYYKLLHSSFFKSALQGSTRVSQRLTGARCWSETWRSPKDNLWCRQDDVRFKPATLMISAWPNECWHPHIWHQQSHWAPCILDKCIRAGRVEGNTLNLCFARCVSCDLPSIFICSSFKSCFKLRSDVHSG